MLFNVRSKMTQVSLMYRKEPETKKWKKSKTKKQKRICSEVSVDSLGIHGVGPEE